MRKRLLTLAVAVLTMLQTVWAYDFSATSPSGHTLYYEIISGTTNVGVVRPGTGSTYDNYVTGNVVIPATVTYGGTTYNVTELRSVNYYYGTFRNCSGLTSVTIPNSVNSIGEGAFYECIGLISVTIPNSVTSIGDNAFYKCRGLSSVTIPNSVTSIGGSAFFLVKYIIYNGTATGSPWGALSHNGFVEDGFVYVNNTKTSLLAYIGTDTNVTIPNSVTSIRHHAFYGCSGLTSVTIPNSVTFIGSDAFAYCSGLPSVTIPNSVTSIAWATFESCYGLTSITIPNSVTSIGAWAFRNCRGLTSITIPNSVTSIEYNAFYECTGLISVTIPNSVTSIGDNAFYSCSNISNVYVKGINPPSIEYNTFPYLDSARFYVPCQSVSTYKNTSNWSGLSSLIYGKNFWEYSYDFVVNDSTLGSVSFTEIDCDSNVVVTVTENIDCQLAGWSDGGTGNPRTFHLTGDTMVTAILDYIPYSVIVQPNDTIMGTVIGGGEYKPNSSATVAAIPTNGYQFTNWSNSSTLNPYIFTVTKDTNLVAYFEEIVPDTSFVHDTTYVPIHDTVYITDTTRLHDTIYLPQYIHDTTYVVDTLLLTDTIYLPLYIYDTIYIHDTIYIRDSTTGIEDVSVINAKIYSSRSRIVVEGADGNSVMLFDMQGRLLSTKRDEYSVLEFEVPISGAYFVKIGNYKAKKVVVIK